MTNTIAEKHSALLWGLRKLYHILLEMRYISESDMIRPPQTTEDISDELLQELGYDSEVIELIKLMPALRSKVAMGWQTKGTELIPKSKAVGYDIDRDYDWIHYLRWGDDFSRDGETKLLPPWMLRLTLGHVHPRQYGTCLLYDTRKCEIIEWAHYRPGLWDEMPRPSTDTVFNEIVANFRTLVWVTCFVITRPESRKILQNPLVDQAGPIQLPIDPQAAMEELKFHGHDTSTLSKAVNRWRFHQNFFQDFGC